MGDDSYYRALYQFCQRAGSEYDRDNQQSISTMSDEDKEWLQNCMKELIEQTDPIRQLKKHIQTIADSNIKTPSEDEKKKILEATELICDLCIDQNLATDFAKVGGFRVLVPMIVSDEAEIRASACNLFAELAQNHEYIQKLMLSKNATCILIHMIENDDNIDVRIKALYALSAFTRNNPDGIAAFLKNEGVQRLLTSIESNLANRKFISKASFLLDSLAIESPDCLAKENVFTQAAKILPEMILNQSDFVSGTEYLLSLLNATYRASDVRSLRNDNAAEYDKLVESLNRLLSSEVKEQTYQVSKEISDNASALKVKLENATVDYW